MINMAMTAEEAKEEYGAPGATTDPELPKYPYGLIISLDDETMKKLGLTELPDVGYVMKCTAFVTVTDIGSSQSQGGEPEQRMSLQITDMQLDAPQRSNADIAAALYPNQGG